MTKKNAIIALARLEKKLQLLDLRVATTRSELSEPVFGEMGEKFMSKKITYSDEPISAKIIEDFLPPPEDLVFREENTKITIVLSKKSIDFFKKHAKKRHTGYQSMIRALLDKYVASYS